MTADGAVPLRILHVVPTARPRGAETFAADLVRSLASAGVDQTVVVMEGGGGSADDFDVDFAARTLPATGGRPARGRLARVLFPALGVRRIARQWQPDVVQAHGGDALKCCVVAGIGRRFPPLVYRNIGLVAPWAQGGLRRRTYSTLMRRAERVVAVAEVVAAETVERFGVRPERVTVIPNAVAPARVEARHDAGEVRSELGVPVDGPVILSLSSLTWEKDPLVHLEATQGFLRRHPGASHLFVGDGPLRQSVETAARRTGLATQVHVLGVRSDVGDLLGASDAVLFASRAGGMEGMPAVVIEAGMAGKPVVGFSVAGVSEVVSNGLTGILVPPGDVTALAEALEELLADPQGAMEMGRRARQICLSEFDINSRAAEYLWIYEQVARPTAPPGGG